MYKSIHHRQSVRLSAIGLIAIGFLGVIFLLIYHWAQSNTLVVLGLETNVNTPSTSQPNGWELILVNRQNPLPEEYGANLIKLQDGQAVDARIYPALKQMFDAAKTEGILLYINSSYRTTEEQKAIVAEKIAEYQEKGNTYETAKTLAEKWVALPGASEHQTGLAVDISTQNSWIQEADVVWTWLIENSYKYGFVQRYPADKSEITGIINEPWHYRYVGTKAAQEMKEQHVCLEEYLAGKSEAD